MATIMLSSWSYLEMPYNIWFHQNNNELFTLDVKPDEQTELNQIMNNLEKINRNSSVEINQGIIGFCISDRKFEMHIKFPSIEGNPLRFNIKSITKTKLGDKISYKINLNFETIIETIGSYLQNI